MTHDPNNERCRATIALRCPVGIECRHGYDFCPECDPCTCLGTPPPGRAWYSDVEVVKAVHARKLAETYLEHVEAHVKHCAQLGNPAWVAGAMRQRENATASLMDAMAQYRRVHPTILHRLRGTP